MRGQRWKACRPRYFLPVRVPSRLMPRHVLEELLRLHQTGRLRFFGALAALADAAHFWQWLLPMRQCEWEVYAKRPFAGPQAVLAYLSRYTHRAAISNSRLPAMDEHGASLRWQDYRVKACTRHKTMTLAADEFMRRFLLHVLPCGFHRIKHYGLQSNCTRKDCLALARELLHVAPAQAASNTEKSVQTDVTETKVAPVFVCWHCGKGKTALQGFVREQIISAPPTS